MSHRIYTQIFSSVYPMYVSKAEKKGRTQQEVDTIIMRLTGYNTQQLKKSLEMNVTFEDFWADAPQLNKNRVHIKGVVCGVRVEEVEEDLMREIRYLDLMIEWLARGKKMEKILLEG